MTRGALIRAEKIPIEPDLDKASGGMSTSFSLFISPGFLEFFVYA
jgi:hypothetical protein